MDRSHRRTVLSACALAAMLFVVSTSADSAATDVKPYAVPVVADYQVRALLSVGDRIPETSDPTLRYQMIGIPDGLGAYRSTDGGRVVLFMNHELANTTLSEPVLQRPLNRGAFVSRFVLDGRVGTVLSGERAYDTAYQENKFVGPAAQANNSTPAFGRFCSAFLAGPGVGFDRYVYLTNEEAGGSATFDGLGGQTVAVFDNEAHALPKLGHFSKENSLVMAGTGTRTVILSLEDGPSGPDSQLYMYLGTKDKSSSSGLRRNGLDNGKLYTFVANAPFKMTELSFQEGAITGRWVEIPGAESMSDAALEAAADARGAFGFVRIEDGAFNRTFSGSFYFVTTGGNAAAGNKLGRLYHLLMDPNNPLGVATLEIVYNADRIIAQGGDVAISPDNVDTSQGFLMIQEDGTAESRPEMVKKGRDGSIWRFPLNGRQVVVDSRRRLAEVDPPGRDGVPVGAGVWESSGIIDASSLFAGGWWLFDVQAHPPTKPPAPNTVEDGQLLAMVPK